MDVFLLMTLIYVNIPNIGINSKCICGVFGLIGNRNQLNYIGNDFKMAKENKRFY